VDTARWEQLQSLFHRAIDLPAAQRDALLARECADAEMRAEVHALLEEDARSASLLDEGVARLADRVLGTAVPPLIPKQPLGRYRIKSVLGEGGMGVVYLAERIDLGTLVAIKILRDGWLSPARRERFANEQRTLAQLTHPSIARFYDADTLPDGTPWFVMEYVEGIPLTDYCSAHHMPLRERLTLLRTVAEAVQYAHRHLIIHRDLKPSNILVRQDGTVALLDFGISKQMESVDVPTDHTRTGVRFMTPAYAAPEQMRGGQSGVHTDVYSLGVVLYELLTGRLPYDLAHRSPSEAETMVREHEAVKPSAVARRVAQHTAERSRIPSASKVAWADLDVLCLTAMHKDPQRRYRSVEALIRDIDHFLRGEPLEARPESLPYRAGKYVTRHWRGIGATAAALAAVVALVTVYTVRLASARTAAVVQATRTERIQRFMLNMFSGGDETAGPADTLHVVTMLGRGVSEARGLDLEPAVQAELYGTLGGIYEALGNFERADTLLRAALDRRRTLEGPTGPDVAASLIALGALRSDQAAYDDAERLVRQGLAIGSRSPSTDRVQGHGTIVLGEVLENRGVYDSAIQVLQDAVRLQSRSNGDVTELGEALSELANSEFYIGHFRVSDSINRQVLAIDRRLYGDRHPRVADDLINLGAIQHELGDYPQAEQFYRQAFEMERAWYGPEHPEVASVLTMLGRTLVMEHRYDDADSLLREALAIQEHAYGPVHPRVASALNALGSAALSRGALDDAQADFTRMRTIYQSVYGDNHYLLGIAASDLGSVAYARHNDTAAERLFREAVRRLTASLSADHLNTGIARIKLGQALVHEHRYPEAETELLAGSQIVAKQTSPSETWLSSARSALTIVHDSLRQAHELAPPPPKPTN
jgi:eukaryotic-like serine/threonine-protein kinase